MLISEELLDAELPKSTQESTVCGMESSTAESGNKRGSSAVPSTAEGFQLSDRLGAKATTISVLDRLGVKKVIHESDSPLLHITDHLGDAIIAPVPDRLCSRKVISLRSEGVTGRIDSNPEVSAPGNRRSISVLSQSERCNVSMAQVAPTAVKGTSRLTNVNVETEPFSRKVMHRPLDEDCATSKDQVRVENG
jgi:hypothetical protein